MLDLNVIEDRTVVMLKMALGGAESVSRKLSLAEPGSMRAGDPTSLWYGPDCWLLSSESRSADELIARCREALAGEFYTAIDYSHALSVFSLSGSGVRDVLASGTGVDLREHVFVPGSCKRTRLAGIAAIIVAVSGDEFEVLVDQSYANYFHSWVSDTASIVELARTGFSTRFAVWGSR